MLKQILYLFFHYLIALVWLVSGLYCKVLGCVPRHEIIVGEILGAEYATQMTLIIGLSEILMAIWIVSNYQRKLNAAVQIAVILLMNFLEFSLVPGLLLWGKWNLLFAILFCIFIYVTEFHLKETQT